MEAFFVPTFVVAVAEIGDKTQLLALLLAARYRRPWPIIWGMTVATLINHLFAGVIGVLVAQWLSPALLSWLLAASFIAVALWTLVPDKLDDDENTSRWRFGPFLTTAIAFFLAEMGDKTQIATVMLAAQYDSLFWVILGSTLGLLLANVPVVLAGKFAADKLPLDLIRRIAAVIFLILGLIAGYNALQESGLSSL